MSAKATFREVGEVTIVDLKGPLRLGSSAVLRTAMGDLTNKQCKKVILNFRDVPEIDSAGVGELLSAFHNVKSKDGQLKLLNPPKKVHDVLKFTQLLKVMDVYTDEELAIQSFG
jgi:anti-sigma B factor antagonist